MAVVLDIREPLHDVAFVVVIDQHDSTRDLFAGPPFGLNKARPYEVANRFRPRRATLRLDFRVKLPHQRFI
jgi:hypothetical protein